MAEKVTMWRSKRGNLFGTPFEAEQDDSAHAFELAFSSAPGSVLSGAWSEIADWLAAQGYRITNINSQIASG